MHIHYDHQAVNFPDIDAGGVMFHGRYLDYYDRARHQFFLSHGINLLELLIAKTALIVVDVNLRYMRPVMLLDQLHIYSQAVKLSGKCLQFTQVVHTTKQIDPTDFTSISESQDANNLLTVKLISVDIGKKKAVELPDMIKNIF